MIARRAYKVRLYPTKAQEQRLMAIVGATRFVWNHYLALRAKAYEESQGKLHYAILSRDLTVLRKQTEWMKAVNLDILGASLRNLDNAYGRFFKKTSGFPNFKRKSDDKQFFSKKDAWSIARGRICILKGFNVKFRGTIDPTMPKRTLIISRTATGKWYASAVYEKELKKPRRFTKPLGIDLGLKNLAITSDGQKYDVVPSLADQLAKLQRNLSRKTNGSRNRHKAKVAVTRIHERITNIRRDHTHKVSHAITSKNHAVIVCEDLNVKGMMGNHKLARSIGNASWGELVRQLEYKQVGRGGEFIKVDRFFPSSKTCSGCGFLRESLPLNIREWNCPNCGAKLDRDVNAAKNILKEGLRNSLAWRPRGRRSANVA